MTNDELGSSEYRPSFCNACGEDFRIAVDEEDSVKIICECSAHDPEEFVEDLAEALPLPSQDPEESDDTSKRGFQ